MIKRLFVIFVLLLPLISLGSSAYSTDIDAYMTDEMRENLPDDIISGDNEGEALISFKPILSMIGSFVKGALEAVLKHLFVIIALVIICSLFSLFCDNLKSEALKKLFSYLSSLCFALVLYGILNGIWDEMTELFERISVMMKGITPAVTLIYSLGGNINSAAVTNAGMSIMLTVFEEICNFGIRPILQICFGFSLVSCLSGSINLAPLSKFVQNVYTTVLVFVISIMTTVMSMQSFLANSNDGLAMRTVRFASSAAVPIVGGALSEATAGVASSIGVLKSTFGVVAVIALCMMILPTLISIWMNKLVFSLGGAVCAVFGANREGEIIGSASRILNFALAITFSVSLMFVINLCIFAGAAVALGG